MVTVCRGCCCGTDRKHPDTDHDAQLRRLEAAVRPHGVVRVSDCIDACGQSNVVIVQPSPAGRRRRGRPTWLGWINDEASLVDVVTWLAAGGPGIAPLPEPLELHTFRPPRHSSPR
jgi:hypothetical protein